MGGNAVSLQDLLNILSMSMGVTSLVLAVFAIWLSWAFYKESRGQNDRVQEAVGRIENAVNAVHGNIQQIVQQAVAAWVKSSSGSDAETQLAQDAIVSIEEMRDKLERIESNKDPDVKSMVDLVTQQQMRMEALLESMREARIRSIFPGVSAGSAHAPAVVTSKIIESETRNAEEGEIILQVMRPASLITGTVKLGSALRIAKEVHLDLIEKPELVSELVLRRGFGADGSLNVHLHAPPGQHILIGNYKVRYRANFE